MWFTSLLVFCLGAVGINGNEDSYTLLDDMRLSKEQLLELKFGNFLPGYGAKAAKTWSLPIPYIIDPSITKYKTGESLVQSAISDIEQTTCIRFKKRTKETKFIWFYKGKGCNSGVGVHGGINRISLTVWCWYKGAVIHEIMHSLGFYHEQCRPDREKFIKIIWNNIPKNKWGNFEVQKIDSLGVPYDLDSVMHYGSREFGGRKMTIETLNPKDQYRIGQRKELSKMDILGMNLLYKCPGFTRPPPGFTTPKPRPPPTTRIVTKRATTTLPPVTTRKPTPPVTLGPSKTETICENRGKSISCPFGAYLDIKDVLYGRMDTTTCPGRRSASTSCKSTEAEGILQRKCNKKRKCWLPINSSLFPKDPCPGTYKYLSVTFVCVSR